MEEQLKTFRTLSGKPYRLLPLPMADAVIEEEEEKKRLPATYANFLIMNNAVFIRLITNLLTICWPRKYYKQLFKVMKL